MCLATGMLPNTQQDTVGEHTTDILEAMHLVVPRIKFVLQHTMQHVLHPPRPADLLKMPVHKADCIC